LNGAAAYSALRARFGVLRTNPQFWRFSDQMQRDHLQREPYAHGLLDYTRLEPN
jgi:hypothetical protein